MTLQKLTLGIVGGALVLATSVMFYADAAKAQTAKNPTALNRKAAQAALHAGFKALTAKKTKPAITDLTRAIKSGKLRSNELAKALYYRGQAYRAAKRPADAIADLTSALWMKGALSKREREAAMALRQKTYQQVGVAGPALAFGSTTTTTSTAAPAKPTAQAAPRSTAASIPTRKPTAGWAASTAPAKPATSTNSATTTTNGVTSFFNNLFGGGSGSSATTGSVGTQSQSSASSTSGNSATAWQQQTRKAQAPRTNVARAQPQKTRSTNSGKYFIQVASLRDPGRASSLAGTVATRHRSLLQGRKPTVETAVLGNMGKFYLVRIRAFRSKADASKLCGKLLASGLDCLVNRS